MKPPIFRFASLTKGIPFFHGPRLASRFLGLISEEAQTLCSCVFAGCFLVFSNRISQGFALTTTHQKSRPDNLSFEEMLGESSPIAPAVRCG